MQSVFQLETNKSSKRYDISFDSEINSSTEKRRRFEIRCNDGAR